MKTSKYFSIIFILIIFGFSIGLYFNYIITHTNNKIDSLGKEKYSNYIDWGKEYPIWNQNEKQSNKTLNRNNSTLLQINKIYIKLKKIISDIEASAKTQIPGRIFFVELGHKIDKLLGINIYPYLDDTVKLKNEYFGFITTKKDDFAEDGKRIVEFAKYNNEQGIKFAYILCPSKFSESINVLPKGLIDYSNKNANTMLKELNNNNIPLLDLRKAMEKEYVNYYDAFYKGDVHWKPETGFWASKHIISFINKKFNTNIDESIVQENNFSKKIYKNLFLGSQGKKVSLSLVNAEDFTVIKPNFKTDFYLEVYCYNVRRNGTFEEALLDKNKLKKDYYLINTYLTYLGYMGPVVRIINNNTNSKIKLLCIGNSFNCVVLPFMACAVKEIVFVDVREKSSKHFDGSIKKFITHEKPNVVFLSYHTGSFNPKSESRESISTFL